MRKILLAVAFVAIAATATLAQDAGAIKQMADGRTFQFKAKTATLSNNEATMSSGFMDNGLDASNRHIPLKGDFIVTVQRDSVVSVLPYFNDSVTPDQNINGATTNVTVVVDENFTHFASKQYDYEVQQRKKGVTEIVIKPKDNKELEKYTFDINPDGTAKLVVDVNSVKRITYDGRIVQ